MALSREYGNTEQRFDDQNLVVYFNNPESTTYAFTLVGHPAHPAWITRRAVEQAGTINMQQIGYFAGKEVHFAKLFKQYLDLNEKIKANIHGKNHAINISHKEIAINEHEFILENDSHLEVAQAQELLYENAKDVCKGKMPSFGKYKFETRKPLSVTAKEEGETTFYFAQEIQCVDELDNPPELKKSTISIKQESEIKVAVKQLTAEYLDRKDKGELETAYNYLTDSLKNMNSFDIWEKRENQYFDTTGELLNRDIWRLTIYNNPKNSSQPGIYVAADYESKYKNTPIHCGYVIWFLPPDGTKIYKVMREEFGHMRNDILKQIPKNELQNVRKQIGCRVI